MFSIGELSKRTNVKVPTIRYYEEMGLLAEAERTSGNQRRYDKAGLERLSFIRHARDLGFSIEAILSLIELQEHPDRSCQAATEIATSQLTDVRAKIKRLRALEKELARMSKGCEGDGVSEDCYVLASLADHKLCNREH
ncbi:helix-turn-helix domain-containing protein [Yoonia sp.]|uniref:MerR family transcriptional regulator n=1 Tax=Yoonia sp. TaxID=2212373 RepID=UPI0035900B37